MYKNEKVKNKKNEINKVRHSLTTVEYHTETEILSYHKYFIF